MDRDNSQIMSKTIIVSNRLPLKISNKNGQFELNVSEGGLATGLGSIYKKDNNIWIGWCGTHATSLEEEQEITRLLKAQNLSPIFLEEEEITNYYEGFSNETLWPLFHYMSTYAQFNQNYWEHYQNVNVKFKDAVIKVAEPGDTIWIHDYQLLLLPQLLRDELKDVSIGFFQHIPFPSFEIFRLLPWREEIINGMLGADLIGFHTYDDVRHFISSAIRLLPVNGTANVIHKEDRNITTDAFPMGIDAVKFSELGKTPLVKHAIKKLDTSLRSYKMILSIDRLDYSKGIVQRLQAFEKVLTENPEYLKKIVLIMIVVPSRDTITQYKELKDDIDKLVGNINARFRTTNWHPIHYFYRSFPIESLSALYSRADICLVTPMRDGMNLVCKEFIASKNGNDGVLILSEMAGASKELSDALIVNPNNLAEIYSTIISALEMPEDEQRIRMQSLNKMVQKFDIHHWVKVFMDQLNEVKISESIRSAKRVTQDLIEQIKNTKNQSAKRVFFLDYDGTLVDFSGDIDKAAPDKELYELIENLTKDSRNNVVLISGRKHETLEEWFGHLNVDMIAEHGAWLKTQHEEWNSASGLLNSWKPKVRTMLESYSDRTPGSFIEEKRYSLAWHYRKVERGLGELRAYELENNLIYLTREMGLQLLPGNKVLEVKNVEINKGKAALNYINGKDYDFIMAIGDDHTDEDTFTNLPESSLTIKVGGSISKAKYFIKSVRETRAFLKNFV